MADVQEPRADEGVGRLLEQLARSERAPFLAKVSGRIRLDVVDGSLTDPWLVTFDMGKVTVSHHHAEADCTVRGSSPLFAAMCRGEANAMAAVLRGALVCAGDVELLYALQRLFPGPPRVKAPAVEGHPAS